MSSSDKLVLLGKRKKHYFFLNFIPKKAGTRQNVFLLFFILSLLQRKAEAF